MEGRHPPLAGPLPGERYAAGLDLAGEAAGESTGADSTVLAIGRVSYEEDGALAGEPRIEVVAMLARTGHRFDALYAELAAILRDVWDVTRLGVDATGLGAPSAKSAWRR